MSFKTVSDFEHTADANQDNVYEVEVRVEDTQGVFIVQAIRVQVTDIDDEPATTDID